MQKALSRNAAKKLKRSIANARIAGEVVTVPGNARVKTASKAECNKAIKRLAYAADKSFTMFRRVAVPDRIRAKAESLTITADGTEFGLTVQSPSTCTCCTGRCSYHEHSLIKNRRGTLKLIRKPVDAGNVVWNGSTPHKLGDRSGRDYIASDGQIIKVGIGQMDAGYIADADLQTRINADADRRISKAMDKAIAANVVRAEPCDILSYADLAHLTDVNTAIVYLALDAIE